MLRLRPALLSLSLLAVGCQPVDPGPPPNQLPTATIFAPVEGSSIGHGDPINLNGSCIDAETSEPEIVAAWSSDLDGELLVGAPDEQGNTSGSVTALSEGSHVMTLTCTDSDGGVGTESRTISVQPNQPPTVEIEEPDSGDQFTTDEAITMQIRVRDDVDAAADIVVSVSSDLDGELATGLTPDSQGDVLAVVNLLSGEHMLTVSATDREGGVGTAGVAVQVTTTHEAPDCVIVEPVDGAFEAGDNVLFRGNVSDPDVDPELLQVHWSTDLAGEFAVLIPDSDGNTETFYDGLEAGDHILRMRVVDEENFECTADTSLRVCAPNDPPTATLTAPAAGQYLFGEMIVFGGSAGDDLTPGDELRVTWTSDVDGELNSDSPDTAGNLSFQTDLLSAGQHVIRLSVNDLCGNNVTATSTIVVFVDSDNDGFEGGVNGDDCDDSDPNINPDATETPYDGIDQDCNGSDLVDNDGDGYASELVTGGDDCDDNNPSVNPGALDIPYDGVDQDCSGTDAIDQDGDGFEGGVGGTDCNDNNPNINPGASEVPYNNIDEDCSGADLTDVDGDGFASTAVGGTDCDDGSLSTYPGAPEVAYDGIDQDCNGSDTNDADLDGFDAAAAGGPDCDDANPSVFPGAPETPYDGIDQDCSGADWNDVDGDGFAGLAAGGGDCDDNNPGANPGAAEIPYNGIDEDCSGSDLNDADGDGFAAIAAGGTDCNDNDFLTNPAAADIPYDGLDQDCDGIDLSDVDGDGFNADVVGGLDCNDFIPSVFPGAPEVPGDGLDNDCNGSVDDVDPTSVPALGGNPYLCSPIDITGAGSYAPPGPPLTFEWFIAAKPAASTVDETAIGDVTLMVTTFTPDIEGTFLLGLTVTQGLISDTDYLVVDVTGNPTNQPPVADAGADVSVSASVTAYYSNYNYICPTCPSQSANLDGSASTDPDGNPLDYAWSTVSGSASFGDASAATTTVSLQGGSVSRYQTVVFNYTIQLAVTDCELEDDVDTLDASYSCTCN